ncbi:MAG: putative 2OG-Fe(II) oxygenase [Gammaproteobacteria bacterium]|nr:putative 2OG-Fe(II) oxygenase [Gammaproteobacteria bacterium]
MADLDATGLAATQLLHEAMSLHQQGRLSEAETFYRRVLDVEPNHPQALRLWGILARECGELATSLSLLTCLTEITADDPASLSELALTHMMSGHLYQADAYFRQALVCDPYFYKALANLGALLHRRGHLQEAISMYRRCLDLQCDDLEVRCNLANALMDAGKGDEALAECDAALSVSPDDPFLLANQGGVLCGLEEFELAARILEQVAAADFVDDMALINQGFAYSRLGRAQAAVDVLGRAATAYPDSARAAADLANAWVAVDEIDNALECCESFLARHPGERLVLANYVYALRDAGRIDEAGAILDFNRLLKVQDIDVPSAYESLAAFNHALAIYIQGHASLLANPLRKATTGGEQTGELDPSDNAAISVFADLVNGVVRDTVRKYRNAGFSDHPAMACAADSWTLRIWATVLQAGGCQTPHLHPMAWLSGVYYVQLPSDLESTGGLEFGSPPAHLHVNSKPDTYPVDAREGRLVLFPSYFYHCTKPFISEQARISVAFDVIPESVRT